MNLLATFSGLTPSEKAGFLARVAHEATIFARLSYVPTAENPERNFDRPDAIVLRDANNFVHRIVGYIMHVLDGTEYPGQDEGVIEMIELQFSKWKMSHLLDEWLKR